MIFHCLHFTIFIPLYALVNNEIHYHYRLNIKPLQIGEGLFQHVSCQLAATGSRSTC